MRAMRLHEIGSPLKLSEIPSLAGENDKVVISMKCAALNRRDYWIQHGQYPGIALPVTLGSDGAGTTDGREVIINPGLNWGESVRVQGPDFNILGMPTQGTLAEEVLVPKENVFDKPNHLSWEEAAALPLAGVTAFRALFIQGNAAPLEKVLITGIGGGVALAAMQFAIAHRMEVCVTSGSDDKLSRALAMGAKGAVNYHDPDWIKTLTSTFGGFDLIIDSAGGENFSLMQRLVNPGGRIVVYGGTLGKIQNLSPQVMYWRQMHIIGSTMGSPKDFSAMLLFVNTHHIKPVVDSVFDLAETNAAMDKLRESAQFGKIVIRIAS